MSTITKEAVLAKYGYAVDNGKVVPLPAVRKAGAVKDLELATVGEHTATRGKIFGHSITAVIRWCGANRLDFRQVRKMLLEMGCSTIADTTVRIQLTAGRKSDLRRGEAAELTAYQEKIIRSAAGALVS